MNEYTKYESSAKEQEEFLVLEIFHLNDSLPVSMTALQVSYLFVPRLLTLEIFYVCNCTTAALSTQIVPSRKPRRGI